MIRVKVNDNVHVINKLDLLKSSYITSQNLVRFHYVPNLNNYQDHIDVLCLEQMDLYGVIYNIESAMVHNNSLYVNCSVADRDESKFLNKVTVDNRINDTTTFTNIHLIFEEHKYKIKVELLDFDVVDSKTVYDILQYVNLHELNIGEEFHLEGNILFIG